MRRTFLRAGAVVAAAGAVVLALAAPAAAHVTVNPNSATQGGYAKVSFRVPNEKDTASTVKVEVNIPIDAPIASVSVRPVPGWTVKTEKTKLTTPVKAHDHDITEVTSKITWTAAAGAEIKPGTFQEFDVSLGPLPETDQIVFKALQTYSDGDIVRWIDEPAAAGAAAPEHPAPVLKLTKASAATQAPAAVTNAPAVDAADDSSSGSSSSSTGTILGSIGLVAGLAGLVVALLAYRRATPTA